MPGRKERQRVAAEDPLRLIDGFDAVWNAHDEEGVLNHFTEDAVARFVPPSARGTGGL